jgi:hypothetical protein
MDTPDQLATVAPPPEASPTSSDLILAAVVSPFVLLAGAVEAWYGRSELLGDDIAYLDVANLLHHGDWHAALNPLWSLGYPILLALIRPTHKSSIRAELTSIFFLNMAVYLAAYLAFLWLIRQALLLQKRDRPDTPARSFAFIPLAAALIFVNVQTAIGRVYSIGPDQLVTCLFFLASGLLLRFIRRPDARNAALLGAVLGLGFVVKAIFLPLAFIVAACAVLATRRLSRLLPIAAAFLLFAVPYCAALSWALGRPTIGEASSLNYAFHVNRLPHWMGWQGGPVPQGNPIHPLPLAQTNPPVFLFPEPFHVTYPPNYALVYWYDGYHRFFRPANALRAFAQNLHALEAILHENAPLTLALILGAAIFLANQRRRGIRAMLHAWPFFLPALLGVAVYLQVHIEGRYIAGFLAVLAMLPFLATDLRSLSPRRRTLLLLILLTGSAANLATHLRTPLRLALHAANTEASPQWKLARALQQLGLQPGDRVASVSSQNVIRCTWAYAARLHIVAALGNDAFDPQSQAQDLQHFFADPATQNQILALFRQAGARAVVAPNLPPSIAPASPWRHVPQTNAWVLLLEPSPSP